VGENESRRAVHEAVKRHYAALHGMRKPYRAGDRIPCGGRVFDEKELLEATDALLDFWLTAGPCAGRFEEELAQHIGVRWCSLVNSGSSANLLAFMACTSPKLGERRIRPGDEVITAAAAFPTTVSPIVQYGAIPVFVDVSLPSYNVGPGVIEAALSSKTRAVFLAHTLGNPFDAGAVRKFCDTHGLWLIEDNCDALGARCLVEGAWRRTGSLGHIGTSSFYPAHQITMGEGGALYTDDPGLKRIIDSFRDWGRDCWCLPGSDNTCGRRFDRQFGELPLGYDHKYVYSHFGYNLKATDIQAAIGRAQLRKLPGFVEARRRNWLTLRRGLADLESCFVLPEAAENTEPSWFGFILTVRADAGFTRAQLVNHLEERGIQTRMLFSGNLLRHPCFDEMRRSGRGYRVAGSLETTDRIMRDTLWLGVYPGITEEMAAHIVETVRSFVESSTLRAAG
jgi:CDP-6-deoxy-D-xylo-4-hexulose-3-dehydrase